MVEVHRISKEILPPPPGFICRLFLAGYFLGLFFNPWIWGQYVPPKRKWSSTNYTVLIPEDNTPHSHHSENLKSNFEKPKSDTGLNSHIPSDSAISIKAHLRWQGISLSSLILASRWQIIYNITFRYKEMYASGLLMINTPTQLLLMLVSFLACKLEMKQLFGCNQSQVFVCLPTGQ
jgi:hypothetical protein